LLETFYLGFKSIFFSANAVLEEDEEFTYKEFAVAIAVVLMLASLFFVTPFFLTSILSLTGVFFNIIEAMVRLAIFLLYLALVARWSEFHRVLQYHGAEHKTINAYEAGESLDVVNVRRFSRMHPRCGTSFLFIVVIISIILFSIMPDLGFAARLAYRVLLIPVIGAISYELLKLTGKYRHSTITKVLTIPGLAVQRLTTKEPDDEMIEVAVAALENLNRLRD
jgi:uncharacterized protein YqhQ